MRHNVFEYIRAEARLFSLAGSFMSRFFPAARAEAEELAASIRYYPLLGLLLGLAGLLLIKATGAPGLIGMPELAGLPGLAEVGGLPLQSAESGLSGGLRAASSPVPALTALGVAFIYILWLAFATRGLHWDGWADLGDAYGAGYSGTDKFITALKDSRIGAFGVLALVFGVLGQVLLAGGALAQGWFWVLAWAPMWGRQMAITLAHCSHRGFCAAPRPGSLGGLCVRGAGQRVFGLTLLFTCLTGLCLLPLKIFMLSGLFACGLIYALARVSRRSGVLNGDFLGAAIIGGELCVFLAFLAA